MGTINTNMKYTQNWFSQHTPLWTTILAPFKNKPVNVIEIGSFEGMATVWLCENILTHKDAHIDCVDPYQPYLTEGNLHLNMSQAKEYFLENIKPYKDKITLHETKSEVYLKRRVELADIVYVDGDHTAAAALTDGILSHLILKPGGIIIFDDYLWAGMRESPDLPKGAITAFMNSFANQYDLLSIGYQIILRKR